MVEALHGCACHPDATANLLLTAARRVDLRTQVGIQMQSKYLQTDMALKYTRIQAVYIFKNDNTE